MKRREMEGKKDREEERRQTQEEKMEYKNEHGDQGLQMVVARVGV
jgi:hypothetical protein